MYDAVIIGGGFFGASIASHLIMHVAGFREVLIVEKENALLARASRNNQARIHTGYHYPRSLTTAYRSRINMPTFREQYRGAVVTSFVKIYAIARHQSRVNARQFETFCRAIDAPLRPASASHRALFDSRQVEDVFEAEEYAFDANKLRDHLARDLAACNVETRLATRVVRVDGADGAPLGLTLHDASGRASSVTARFVFNCTYSALNHIGAASFTRVRLKHQYTEMSLVSLPKALDGLGITVMDGPFFSLMPYPAEEAHTLSHVRYTPQYQWNEEEGDEAPSCSAMSGRPSSFEHMRRDVSRFLPAARSLRRLGAIREVKTVLCKAEGDDARPILFEQGIGQPNLFNILGAKLDNIYDVLEKLTRLEEDGIFSAPGTGRKQATR